MIKIIVLAGLFVAALSLTISSQAHYSTSQLERQLLKIKDHRHDQKSVDFKYSPKVDPKSYRTDEVPSPLIMKYLPLTEKEGKIAPFFKDIQAVKRYYIRQVGYQKTVDMKKAQKLAHFLSSKEGKVILTYFEGIAEGNLNFYHLNTQNYHLWLAIKMLANKDIKRYARSIPQNLQLFTEFYQKSREMKIEEIQGIPQPSKELLEKLRQPLKNVPSIQSEYGKKDLKDKTVKKGSQPKSQKQYKYKLTQLFPGISRNPTSSPDQSPSTN